MTSISWSSTTLGNVLKPRKDKAIPSLAPGTPFIGMEHVQSHEGKISTNGVSDDYRSLAPKVQKGDVLYGRLRPYLNKVAIAPFDAFASGEFIVIPPTEVVDAKFLLYRLLSLDFLNFTATLDTGDRPRVSWEQISKFKIDLPSIEEQRQIIEILEDHLSQLDAALSDIMQARVKATHFRRSYIHEMTSNIKGAVLAPLLEVCNVYQPKTISMKQLNPNGKFPVYGANGQIGFYDEYNHEESEVTVTCRGATCGTVNVIPDHAWITGNAMVFHPKDERLNKGFLEYVLRGFDFSRVTTGTAQPQITRASLQDLMLPIVSIEMQHNVAETLDNSLSRVEKANNLAQDALLQGLSLRKSLLQAAFTGQLTKEVTNV